MQPPPDEVPALQALFDELNAEMGVLGVSIANLEPGRELNHLESAQEELMRKVGSVMAKLSGLGYSRPNGRWERNLDARER